MSTTIRITNFSVEALSLDNSVEPDLGTGYWNAIASQVPANASKVSVLEFDRNQGITNGDTWIFSTDLTVDGVAVQLQEKVTGTPVGSTMAQCMTAGDTTTGFLDTNDGEQISFTGQSGAVYQLSWSLGINPSFYYDILYTMTVSA